jgi:hypothetical protein
VQRSRLAFAALAATLLVSCTDSLDGRGATGDPETELDIQTMDLAASYKTFAHINKTADASSVGAFDINLYVYGDAADYAKIHPESTTDSPTIPVGTVIVREVLDTTGSIAKLTVMAKGPAGYDSTLGDWWFAEASPDGVPLVTDGALRVGRLADCHSCHVPRESDDFLFGVPAADE